MTENKILGEKKKILLTPGPVPCAPEVLSELAQPISHHRTLEFEKIYSEMSLSLKKVFQTQKPVLTLSSTGTGAMEAAIVNTLSPNDTVIVIVSGKFGQRWSQMAHAYKITVIEHHVDWGQSVKPEDIKKLLEQNPSCRAVLTQACETSTGVRHPIEEISQIMTHYPETLLVVDGITAVGAYHLPFDDWKIDILIGGSQKAFMLPTGLSFICLSDRAWKFYESSTCPKYYWDLKKELEASEKKQTRFSSPVSLIKSLNLSLKQILSPSLSQHFDRVYLRADCARKGLGVMGFEFFPHSPSPSLTVIKLEPSLQGLDLQQKLETIYGITVMGGQEQLKGKVLRIGHIGYLKGQDYAAFFKALKELVPAITQEQLEKALDELKVLDELEA